MLGFRFENLRNSQKIYEIFLCLRYVRIYAVISNYPNAYANYSHMVSTNSYWSVAPNRKLHQKFPEPNVWDRSWEPCFRKLSIVQEVWCHFKIKNVCLHLRPTKMPGNKMYKFSLLEMQRIFVFYKKFWKRKVGIPQ